MSNWKFDAPGYLQDFTDPDEWHNVMAREARDIVLILVESVLGRPPRTADEVAESARTLAYVNPTDQEPPATAETVAVAPWGAFPRAVLRRAPWSDLPAHPDDPDGTLRAADHLGDEDFRPGVFIDRQDNLLHLPVRDRQDEYLEWVLRQDAEGRIRRAILVAEGYDYYGALFAHDEQAVVDLYRDVTGITSISADDLRAPRGVYRRSERGMSEIVKQGHFNPRNRFNIVPGIVHLSHRANSLSAEVNLAGVSALARKDVAGQVLDAGDAERILCCSEGGNPNRNSDPLIAQQAYAQVLAGFRYTLANPVGLYIAGVKRSRLLLPDNQTEVPAEWWKVTRGRAGTTERDNRILRLELEVPASEGITISDLLVDGRPVRFGGQLADLLTVHLFVTRWRRDQAGHGPVVGCSKTCCRRTSGPPQLELSDGACRPGYTLAFPGLVPPPEGSPGIMSARLRHVVHTRGKRLP